MSGINESHLSLESDELVEAHLEVMRDLLRITARPTQRVLMQGAQLAFKADAGLAKRFAERLCWAFTYVRNKKKSATTGRKLKPAVAKLVALMSLEGPPAQEAKPASSVLGKLWKGKRSLQRRISEEAGVQTRRLCVQVSDPQDAVAAIEKIWGVPSRGSEPRASKGWAPIDLVSDEELPKTWV